MDPLVDLLEGGLGMTDRPVTLWRNNRLDGRWQIQLEDLARQFAASPWADLEWPLPRRIGAFVTDGADGLSSVFGEDDYDAIEAACSEALRWSLR